MTRDRRPAPRGWLSLAAATAVALTAGVITVPTSYVADAPDAPDAPYAGDESVEIVVDGNDVRADTVNGLTHKGLGIRPRGPAHPAKCGNTSDISIT